MPRAPLAARAISRDFLPTSPLLQGRLFWSMFVSTFDHFIWNYGTMKDFPMTVRCNGDVIVHDIIIT